MELAGSTVGVVGLGRIGEVCRAAFASSAKLRVLTQSSTPPLPVGAAVARRLQAFNVERILYTGRGKRPAGDAIGATFVDVDTLLAQSDIVIATCALTDDTRGKVAEWLGGAVKSYRLCQRLQCAFSFVGMFNEAAFAKMKPSSIFINTARGGVVDQDALVAALKDHQIAVRSPDPSAWHP